jgi:hypothetical protein
MQPVPADLPVSDRKHRLPGGDSQEKEKRLQMGAALLKGLLTSSFSG